MSEPLEPETLATVVAALRELMIELGAKPATPETCRDLAACQKILAHIEAAALSGARRVLH